MILLIITGVIITLLIILVIDRNIPNRKVFYAFCSTLVFAIALVGHSIWSFWVESPPTDQSTIRHITAQQQIFSDWYTPYKKRIDKLDYNWSQYHRILDDFSNDRISLHDTYIRLTHLETEAQHLRNDLFQMAPPISLDDANYDLTTSLLKKTQEYSEAQLKTITNTRIAADPARQRTDSHQEQSRLLKETMLRHAPDGLFTANEITALRSNLTLPENT